MGASLPRVLHSAPDTVPGCRTGGGSAKKKPGDSWKATRGEVVGVQNVFLGKVVDVEQLSSQMGSTATKCAAKCNICVHKNVQKSQFRPWVFCLIILSYKCPILNMMLVYIIFYSCEADV